MVSGEKISGRFGRNPGPMTNFSLQLTSGPPGVSKERLDDNSRSFGMSDGVVSGNTCFKAKAGTSGPPEGRKCEILR